MVFRFPFQAPGVLLLLALTGAGGGGARGEEPLEAEEVAADEDASPGDEAPPGVEVQPARAAGAARFLEAPEALRLRLAALTRPPGEGRTWRVAQLGDSHTEWGVFTGALAQALADGGTVSPGFVAPYEHGVHAAKLVLDRRWKPSSWRKHVAGGVDGPSGTSAVATAKGLQAQLKLPAGLPAGTRVTVYWDAGLSSGVRLHADGGALEEAREPPPTGGALAQKSWVLGEDVRAVALEITEASVARPFRLCGVAVDRPDARLVMDGLGLGGSVHLHPLHQQRGALGAFLARREPDLVVVWYGTNSAAETRVSPEAFQRQYEELLGLVQKAAPGALVLALGLPDFGMRSRACAQPGAPPRRRGAPGPAPWHAAAGRSTAAAKRLERLRAMQHAPAAKPARRSHRRYPPVVCGEQPSGLPVSPPEGDACFPTTLPTVALLRDRERAAAAARGAAFFDLYAFMGGESGMVRWYCHRPSLALSDFIHLSASGYRYAAAALVEALRAE